MYCLGPVIFHVHNIILITAQFCKFVGISLGTHCEPLWRRLMHSFCVHQRPNSPTYWILVIHHTVLYLISNPQSRSSLSSCNCQSISFVRSANDNIPLLFGVWTSLPVWKFLNLAVIMANTYSIASRSRDGLLFNILPSTGVWTASKNRALQQMPHLQRIFFMAWQR
jgi:hypothetical protein